MSAVAALSRREDIEPRLSFAEPLFDALTRPVPGRGRFRPWPNCTAVYAARNNLMEEHSSSPGVLHDDKSIASKEAQYGRRQKDPKMSDEARKSNHLRLQARPGQPLDRWRITTEVNTGLQDPQQKAGREAQSREDSGCSASPDCERMT